MILRTYFTFSADFPDDAEWDAKGNLVRPGGLAIAEFISRGTGSRGMPTTAPRQHNFYGWAFEVLHKGVNVWCLLQGGEPWLFLTDVPRSIWGTLTGRRHTEVHNEVVQVIAEVLLEDTRFVDVTAFTKDEYLALQRRDRI